LRLGLLIIELNHRFLVFGGGSAIVNKEPVRDNRFTAGLRAYTFRDGFIEFRDHVFILNKYLFEFVAGVVVELNSTASTILVKSINLIPLSYSSLKKLNNCLIFSEWGAFAVRARLGKEYRDHRKIVTSLSVYGIRHRIAETVLRPKGR